MYVMLLYIWPSPVAHSVTLLLVVCGVLLSGLCRSGGKQPGTRLRYIALPRLALPSPAVHVTHRPPCFTQFVENSIYPFDRVYDEDTPNSVVYRTSVQPHLKKCVFNGATSAVIMAGGRHSGKTYTTKAIMGLVGSDLYRMFTSHKLHKSHSVHVSAFEVGSTDTVIDLLASGREVSVAPPSRDHEEYMYPAATTVAHVTSGEGLVSVLKKALHDHKHGSA